MSENDCDDEGTPEPDSLVRAIAAAPSVPIPAYLATLVLLEPGVVVDGAFRIEERLGAGGMGVVYAARDLVLDREVALKLMRLDGGVTQRGRKLPEAFEREARATAKLNHPNIVTLHQFGNWNGLLYLVLERLRGETLSARMERGAVSLADGLAIVERVARALEHTHAAGITHRDLKPQNVFLTSDGGVKVLDFGVSGLVRGPFEAPAAQIAGPATWRSTLSHAGTPGYMAPEQWHGEPQDARTDIWALGVMLYQLVTGALPFGLVAVDARARPASLRARLPGEADELDGVIARCLEPDPAVRTAEAREVADELDAIRRRLSSAGGSAAAGAPVSIATARVQPPRNRRSLAVAGALAATGALAAAAGALAVTQRVRRDGPECNAAARLAGAWDDATRRALVPRFGDALPAWTELERTLDIYARQWTAMANDACRTDAQPALRCLDVRLDALRTFTGQAGALDRNAALATAHALPPLAECADPTRLGRPDTVPLLRRDPDALVALALTVAGRSLDIVHGAAFVGDDLVAVGFASDGASIGGVRVAPRDPSKRGGFVARIARDGTVRWAHALDDVRPMAAAPGRDGSIAIAGAYLTGGTLARHALPAMSASTGTDCFVARLDGDTGEVRWARACGASKLANARGLATDPDGNIYAAGEYGGAATFGGARAYDAAARSEAAPFVASWDPEGELRWVVPGSGTATSRARGIAASADAVVLAARITGTGKLGTQPLDDGGCLIARLDRATGAVRWIHNERGAAGQCEVNGVALHGDRIAVGGRRYSMYGAWIAELALTDGALRWIKQLGDGPRDFAKVLAFAPDGTLAVAGTYDSAAMALDGTTLANHGGTDAYVLRIDRAGAVIGALELGGASADFVRWIGYSGDGRLAIAGRFEVALAIGEHVLRGSSNSDGFLVELQPALTAVRPRRAAAASP